MNSVVQRQKVKKYNVYNVAGDGECLFNAVAYGILFNMDQSNIKKREYKQLATQLRKYVIKQLEIYKRNDNIRHSMAYNVQILSEQMQKKERRKELRDINSNYYRNYYANERIHVFSENQRINMYINQMKKSCTWGGSLETYILAQYVQHTFNFKGIKVYDQNFVKINHYGGDNESMVNKSKQGPIIEIILLGVEKYIKNGKEYSKGTGSHFQFVVKEKYDSLLSSIKQLNQKISVIQIHKQLKSTRKVSTKRKHKQSVVLTENEINKIVNPKLKVRKQSVVRKRKKM